MKRWSRLRAKLFRALADPLRLEILEYLRSGEKCVCEIVPQLGVAQPLVSRHLAILKSYGLVKDRREGNKRFYSITNPAVFKVIDAASADLLDTLIKQAVEQIA
ncbi:MAG: metalloregulator ArsR/SmtB family transcription factor [Candidatus Bathyarchaeia archaeon]